MSAWVPVDYLPNIQRLALGLEPIDSERRARIAHPIRIVLENAPPGRRGNRVERHESCLHALLYTPGLATSVRLRLLDPSRRLVPRRLSVPILTAAEADQKPYSHRVRRPFLFPGAAYDVSETATGIRGRVERNGKPARWSRVEALLENGTVVGRAHGDDRGEFLLLIRSAAASASDSSGVVKLNVRVTGPAAAPAPPSADLPKRDPFWDLPLEQAPQPGQPDPVSTGEALPDGYTSASTRAVDFVLARLTSEVDPFELS